MSQEVTRGFNSVHPNEAEVVVIFVAVKAVGFGQFGAAPQVTFATHPALLTEPSLLNLKVKQPSTPDAVNGPGIAVPQYPPANPPGTNPAPLVLAICGASISAPSKTYKASQFVSVSKAEKSNRYYLSGWRTNRYC